MYGHGNPNNILDDIQQNGSYFEKNDYIGQKMEEHVYSHMYAIGVLCAQKIVPILNGVFFPFGFLSQKHLDLAFVKIMLFWS